MNKSFKNKKSIGKKVTIRCTMLATEAEPLHLWHAFWRVRKKYLTLLQASVFSVWS